MQVLRYEYRADLLLVVLGNNKRYRGLTSWRLTDYDLPIREYLIRNINYE